MRSLGNLPLIKVSRSFFPFDAFVLEKSPFFLEPECEAAEFLIGSKESVAWNYDGNRVFPGCVTYSSRRAGMPDLLGKLAI